MGSAWVNCQLKEQGCFSRRFSPTFCASPALVAQWIEQRFPKPCVAGSIPAGGTILVSCFVACRRAIVALTSTAEPTNSLGIKERGVPGGRAYSVRSESGVGASAHTSPKIRGLDERGGVALRFLLTS